MNSVVDERSDRYLTVCLFCFSQIFSLNREEIHGRRGKYIRRDLYGGFGNCYISYPFDSTELILRINAVLRRVKENSQPENRQNIVKLPRLTINNISRITEVRGKQIDLTPKEYALLWLLSISPAQVFTREQLLYKIWDSDYYGNPGVSTLLVKRLREKIETDSSTPFYIRTIHGVGYKPGVAPC